MHPPRCLLASLALAALASGQNCYWPNGGLTASNLVACPVPRGAAAAACCFENHYCMSNGVCFSKTELTFYRGACTNKDWTTSGCPSYCDKKEMVGGVPGAHVGVATCGNRKYACQTQSNCANETFEVPIGYMLSNQYLQSDLGSVSTAIPTATSSVGTAGTTGGAGATTCPSTDAVSNGISSGAAAGIGVGVGAPLALAVGLLTILPLREKKKTRAALSAQAHDGTGPASPWAKSEQTAYAPVEIQTQQNRHELS